MKNQRVLVCGGRVYKNKMRVFVELNNLRPSVLIHGGASGADSLAGEWAEGQGVEVLVFNADWNKHGKAAGPIRNRQMLDDGKPDLVLAFPGGKGTANMIRQASDRNLIVIAIQ